MRVAPACWMIFALFADYGWAAYEKEVWVSSDQYAEFHVVVSASASVTEQFAAGEFVDLWRQTTGQTITSSTAPAPAPEINVWIGREGVPEHLIKWLPFDEFGDEGFVIQTREKGDSRQTKSNHLLILGGKKRGALYGVYQFFEDAMGVRWLTPELTHIPAKPSEAIRAIDFKHIPPLRYRDTNFQTFVKNPKFALVHRLNGYWVDIPHEWGGHWEFEADAFAGTFHDFVSPEDFSETHPEYFSEIRGKREIDAARTQLDLTNPEVLAKVTDGVLGRIQDTGSQEIVLSLSQMPNPGWNTSWAQAAIDELEGSAAGSLIRFVNLVAGRVAELHPGLRIETLAEGITRTPPSATDPADNVIVRVRTVGTDSSLPLHDATSRANRAFRKDIQGWLKKSEEVWVWDNVQNTNPLPLPHANIPLIQGNARYLANSGVTGLFADAGPVSPLGDLEPLRAYVTARAMWNPDDDWEKHYFDFLLLYYGDASPAVGEYLQVLSHAATRRGREMPVDSRLEWLDPETIQTAVDLRRKAIEAVGSDAELAKRVEQAFVPLDSAILLCPPTITKTTGAYHLTRPSGPTLVEYTQSLRSLGMEDAEDVVRSVLGEKEPPLRQEIQVAAIHNPWATLWVTPGLGGVVQRWFDVRSGKELLKAFEDPLEAKWAWRDWIGPADGQASSGFLQGSSDIVSNVTGALTLRRTTPTGLAFSKTLALAEDANILDVTFEITNPTFQKQTPTLRTIPEFWTLGTSRPEVWIENSSGWEEIELDTLNRETQSEGSRSGEGLTQWALRFPGKGVVILQQVPAGSVAELRYSHDLTHESLTLDVTFASAPIEPGATWRAVTTFQILDHLPFDVTLTRGEPRY